MKHINTDFGIEGYYTPDNLGHLNIKRVAGFSKNKGNDDFISQVQKLKKFMPGPEKYELSGSMIDKKKHAFMKSRR